MDNKKKRKRINRIYAATALVLLAVTVLICALLIMDALHPQGNEAGTVLAGLVVVLLVIIFVIGGAALQLLLLEAFVLVRYLLTDPRKRPGYTACNIASLAVAVLMPVVVLLLNVLEVDRDGTLSLGLLIGWGVLWALFRIVYCVLRRVDRRRENLLTDADLHKN